MHQNNYNQRLKKYIGKSLTKGRRKKRNKEFSPKKISKPPYMVARDAVSESAVKVQRKVILLLHYALQCTCIIAVLFLKYFILCTR